MNSSEKVVSCARGDKGYGYFFREVDVTLVALAGRVEAGGMTSEEALESWKPCRGHWPELYEFSAEELKEAFPDYKTVLDVPPASSAFWRRAARARTQSAGFSENVSPASGEVFEVLPCVSRATWRA